MKTHQYAFTKTLLIAALFLCTSIVYAQDPFAAQLSRKPPDGIYGTVECMAPRQFVSTEKIQLINFSVCWDTTYKITGLVVNPPAQTPFLIEKVGDTTIAQNVVSQQFQSAPLDLPGGTISAVDFTQLLQLQTTLDSPTGEGYGYFYLCGSFVQIDGVRYPFNFIQGARLPIVLPLPVTIMQFNLAVEKKFINIAWSCVNERTNKGFEIERSKSVASGFKKIGWIASKSIGNDKHNYEFTDPDVVTNTRYYYRLKQIDNDGHFKYHEIKSVIFRLNDDQVIHISPNPVLGILQIQYDRSDRDEVLLQVIDAKGSVVITRRHKLDAGNTFNLNVAQLTKGQYFLSVTSKQGLVYKKSFIKR